MENKVELQKKNLAELLFGTEHFEPLNLRVPDYQRTYCWEEKNVIRLLDDIKDYAISKEYHLGSIILHKTKDDAQQECYHIVDGQQRLVTLSLLLLHLGECDIKLLDEKFESEEALQYIAYNKWLIGNYIDDKSDYKVEKIINHLSFSVLVLESEHLDLAYTFFTSENGKGKSLSDYDLLKSHHLRFIAHNDQAEHLASRWDNIVLESDNDNTQNPLGRTFEINLFRLRKWMRKRNWDNNAKRKVKQEFEAAPVISCIPPFGEQFNFYESIQGGTHFFAYAEHFIYRYNEFKELNCYKSIHKHLTKEKHWWYRDVVEGYLFAYYLKFGTLYIDNACMLILDLISHHRYVKFRAYLNSVLDYASTTEIVMMIDQATSPTFFLAEMHYKIKQLPKKSEQKGTRWRYNNYVENIRKELRIESNTIN